MDGSFTSFLIISILMGTVDANAVEGCISPQYAELGSQSTVHCTFNEGFYGVYWYNSTDIINDEPTLLFKGSEKSGTGYDSHEFDIHPNGSLIINHVTLSHDHQFAVVKLNSIEDTLIPNVIRVVTTVRPSIPYPVISQCGNESRFCVVKLHQTSSLTCSAKDSRPEIKLLWLRRTNEGDEIIPQETSPTFKEGAVYSSSCTLETTPRNTSLLQLLICRAETTPMLLEHEESLIVVENENIDFFVDNPKQVFLEQNSEVKLNCSNDPIGFLIWKKFSKDKLTFEDIVIAIFGKETFIKVSSNKYVIGTDGSLVFQHVSLDLEGVYSCVYGNGHSDGMIVYETLVYVKPNPPYLIISGCETQRYCYLEVETRGTLSCVVRGVRPEVELKWKIPYERSARISFSNQQTEIKDNGDTYVISITTDYVAEPVLGNNRLTIECTVSGKYAYLFELSGKAELLFTVGMPTSSPQNGSSTLPQTVEKDDINRSWVIGILIPILLVMALVVTAVLFVKARRRKRKGSFTQNDEEIIPMFKEKRGDLGLEAKKKMFVTHLKGKYEDFCEAVRPIPYIRDRLYCVDNVYVGGGIDISVSHKSTDNKIVWERIESYSDILADPRIHSTRKIIRGEAGYGKTTLTLQLAYDWCKKKDTSPLTDIDVLILLRLRQLGGVKSIFKAIKQFILPKDSPLSESDIRELIQSYPSESVLVILDGYDEYPEHDMTSETDVFYIITREMFQQISVILTTRSSCLPANCAPQTRHIRLNGFDDNARYEYIRKVLVDSDDKIVQKIKQRLNDNPVLTDLCQVPLFFAMFAHMTQENVDLSKFKTVTNFFGYMVGCFHSHHSLKDRKGHLKYKSFVSDHKSLDKVALESMTSGAKKMSWRKDEMVKRIGKDFYDHYLRVGILVEEEVLVLTDEDESNQSYYQSYRVDVRFYHNLFGEWYAAHALTDLAAKTLTLNLRNTLGRMDPFEMHYVYRFACGLKAKAAENILKYLDGVENSEEFTTLCMLEQEGKTENINERVAKLCSTKIIISDEDSNLKQRSTIELLEIASGNGISIPFVSIENCITTVDLQTWNLHLKSGLSFSNLSTIQEISISEMGRLLTEEKVADIIAFSFQCLELKKIRFDCSLLPPSIKVRRSESGINKEDIEVIWIPTERWFQLNLNSGVWEAQDTGERAPITDEEYQFEVSKFKKEWKQ